MSSRYTEQSGTRQRPDFIWAAGDSLSRIVDILYTKLWVRLANFFVLGGYRYSGKYVDINKKFNEHFSEAGDSASWYAKVDLGFTQKQCARDKKTERLVRPTIMD